jgi:phage-related protein
MIEKNGPDIREPYSKLLEDGIFEVRTQVGNNLARVLYFFYVGKRVIVTHGFIKKTQKTPLEEIKRAKRYRKEFLDREVQK